MQTLELTPEEVRLARAALRSFLDDFGHEEQDVVDAVRRLLAKFETAEATQADA